MFYALIKNRSLIHSQWSSLSNREDSDDGEEIHIKPIKPTKRVGPFLLVTTGLADHSEQGWTCDSKEPKMAGGCPNQDIIDKVYNFRQGHLLSNSLPLSSWTS
jgi:hypothetical protein